MWSGAGTPASIFAAMSEPEHDSCHELGLPENLSANTYRATRHSVAWVADAKKA
jgi:hypothetical protein